MGDEILRRTSDTSFDRILRWALILAAFPGFISPRSDPNGHKSINEAIVFGAILFMAVALPFRSTTEGKRNYTARLSLPMGYLGVKILIFVLSDSRASKTDFVQAYKAYFFLPIIVFFARRKCFTREGLARTTTLLLLIFVIKYSLLTILKIARPTVWVENNYELMTLMGFFFLSQASIQKNRRSFLLGILVAVVLLSGSRSSLLELVVCLAILWIRGSTAKRLAGFLPLIATAYLGRAVVLHRSIGGVRLTDRYTFLSVFLQETSTWRNQDWLIGRPPMTPLSPIACIKLSYYHDLFSKTDGTTCYSVVLHSFGLRVLYDQGFLGALFLVVFLTALLRQVDMPWRMVGVILAIGVVNALSVSSFNSEYMLVVLLACVGMQPGRPLIDSKLHMSSPGRKASQASHYLAR